MPTLVSDVRLMISRPSAWAFGHAVRRSARKRSRAAGCGPTRLDCAGRHSSPGTQGHRDKLPESESVKACRKHLLPETLHCPARRCQNGSECRRRRALRYRPECPLPCRGLRGCSLPWSLQSRRASDAVRLQVLLVITKSCRSRLYPRSIDIAAGCKCAPDTRFCLGSRREHRSFAVTSGYP